MEKRQALLSEAQGMLLTPLFPEPMRRRDGRGRPRSSNLASLDGTMRYTPGTRDDAADKMQIIQDLKIMAMTMNDTEGHLHFDPDPKPAVFQPLAENTDRFKKLNERFGLKSPLLGRGRRRTIREAGHQSLFGLR
jgi:hypothetical protein